jgi:adenylate cyclase
MLRRMGVRGRLLLAFMGISAFALIAAAAAMYSFSEVGGALGQITEVRTPAALDSLELSRQAELIVAAAPKLLAVSTPDEQAKVSAEIAGEVGRLEQLRGRLQGRVEQARLDALWGDIDRMGANLKRLDAAVAERLTLAQERETIMRRVLNTARTARRVSEPGQALIEAKLAEWRRAADEPGAVPAPIEPAQLTETLGSMLPQQRAELVVATLAEATLRIAAADDPAQLAVLATPVKRSLQQLEEHIGGFPPKLQARAQEQFKTFEDGLLGARGLIAVRGLELQALQRAQGILDQNAGISARLTEAVDGLVAEARAEMTAATAEAGSVQRVSSRILIAVVLLSLVSSGLIVWLYVQRDLLRRLSALSGSMLAVAGGNLRVPLPAAGGGDEIGEMTRALTVFRDTAVEIEDKGLREIERARERLIDAIESTSEGFAFYGPDDRLELCNSRYRELLYSDTDIELEAGMSFEAVVRRAVERGLIAEATDDPEGYVRQRLAQHRDPGPPTLQQRADGRWILITERRVAGGGTVAVYSDITELKQREVALEAAHRRTQEAADEIGQKHRELEVLSTKLAKYLSPQVYASIFEGRQDVKLASQRKKLTVFFSDIAGFTELTDAMESEDVTQLLNQYLTEMSRVALEYGATIDKYVGDAVMIFFGDPETRGVKEDALAGVKMAIAMQERLTELGAMWRDAGIEHPLRCRIGIHTGYCTVGNFGSEDRMDYTIIGGAVNLASRLEHEAPEGGILISYETYAHVKDEVHCEALGHIQVRGIGHPVATYRAVDLYANLADGREHLRVELPYLKLDVTPEQMSAGERKEAAARLGEVLSRLSFVDKPKPRGRDLPIEETDLETDSPPVEKRALRMRPAGAGK